MLSEFSAAVIIQIRHVHTDHMSIPSGNEDLMIKYGPGSRWPDFVLQGKRSGI